MATLVLILGCALVWGSIVFWFWRMGAWLPYYIVASSGAAMLIVMVSRELLPIEDFIRAATAHTVHLLSAGVGVQTRLLDFAPGSFLVAGVRRQEWTHLSVGLESSGLLEMAALLGLVLFFPALGLRRRLATLGIALALTFLANILRVTVIVAAVGWGGQGWLDVAHVVLGRLVFFLFAIAIYWFAITRPSLRAVSRPEA